MGNEKWAVVEQIIAVIEQMIGIAMFLFIIFAILLFL